jgi:hypothetical protein
MKTLAGIAATAFCGTLSLIASTSQPAADSWSSTLMKPLMAASFDAGTKKHVVSYFVNAAGRCKLTLMIADGLFEEADAGRVSRVQMTLDPGRGMNFDAADGDWLHFRCKPGALAMEVSSAAQIAMRPEPE